MLYLFYGDDDYLTRARAAAIERRYAEDGMLAAQRFDGATTPWNDVVAACSVLPFFSARQVVRVTGLLGASARRRAASGDDGTKPGISPDGLCSLIGSMPETTILVLEEGTLQATNAHLKALSALDVPKEITPCPVLEGRARAQWVQATAQERGGAIDPAAAAMLAERRSGSLWPVSNAIDTLMAYVGHGNAITREAVELLIAPEEDDNIFHLSDAIAARQAGRALTLLHGLMAGGMVEEQVLATLVGRVRDWALVAALKAERMPESEAIKRLAWKPAKYGVVARGAASFGRGELPRAYQTLVSADEALKSRPSDERPLILDMLVFTLSTRGDPEGMRQTFPIPLV